MASPVRRREMSTGCGLSLLTTIVAIAKAGGVQTRGILIDVPLYLRRKGLGPLDPLSKPSSTAIDLPFLESAMEYFNIEPRVGDVLLVRTGYEDLIAADHVALARGEPALLAFNRWAGVEANVEVMKWIWTTGIVAVGSDNPTFEEWRGYCLTCRQQGC